MDKIYEELIRKEKLLHIHENRVNIKILSELLDIDFKEIWYSWKTHNYYSTLNNLPLENNNWVFICSKNYEYSKLDSDIIILNYESANNNSWKFSKFAKRTSIWIKDKSNWKLKFHQATPIKSFS